ncbi:MAG: D-2-hydroxyacid dehydrogenase [Oscillospiraceae bacterium]|nr:D-2-hydroxyacid dehydrogenase [Clostridiales bacterium]MCI7575017.1 D-2-hydroxyacid dehydrogenase [Clostridiales bacterium]MDD7674131.1 D-2-hydroxyacid dehydrogenase [Oscillospiraceae bacterium]MDY5642361.1 D-2-hydroxyacid dehydrogenase [Candidatus Faecousia sp.]
MKIVVLDGYTENPGDLSWDGLRALGELTVYDRTRPEEAASRIQDAEIIVTNKVPVTRALLDQCTGIRYVSVLATGYNVVDLKAASERGIPVSNVPAYSTAAVGQFTIGMLLEICCQIGFHDRSVHNGDWAACPDFCYWKTPLIELAGKTMGIIGFGRIGRQTGAIARAMGMQVLATGSRPCDEGRAIAEYVDLDTVLRQSDVISLHCPLFPETTGIINKDTIAKMKDGVIILNMARGPMIVEEDLAQALNSGKVYAAGMDVVSQEPIRADNPLLTAKNCFITPHIAWASRECRQRIMDITEQNIRSFLEGNVRNRVN